MSTRSDPKVPGIRQLSRSTKKVSETVDTFKWFFKRKLIEIITILAVSVTFHEITC
jgi:hypothetical protein